LTGEEDFVIDYKEDLIEVKYNKPVLIQNYIIGSIYSMSELGFLFKYFSRHEFGHTQLPKNFYGIEEKRIIYKLLNTIRSKHIVSGYKEFLANFYVLNSTNESPPVKYFQIQIKVLKPVDHQLFSHKDFNFSTFLYNHLILANSFFIFGKWDILKTYFIINKLSDFGHLLFRIFNYYHMISNIVPNIPLIKEKLVKLMKSLDGLNFLKFLGDSG